jgi:hypothetical protein
MSSRTRRGRRFRSPVPAQKTPPPTPDSPARSPQHQPHLIESSEPRTSAAPTPDSNTTAGRRAITVPDLVARISAGEFDEDLYLLWQTLKARSDAVETAKTLHAMASIQLGDWVRLKDEMKNKRLRGQIGHVVERHEDAIVLCLGDHVAADHRHIRCSPLAVDKLPAPPE